MLKKIFIIILFICSAKLQAQVENDTIDNKYLEDQLYFSISYNILNNKPKDDTNSLFSGSLSLGFIKDIPFNKKRNVGLGIGLGYVFNSYGNNILLYTDDGTQIVEEYQNNKVKTHLVELPIEFRWRTSTATKYSFWRIYGGVNLGYTFHSKASLEYQGDHITIKNFEGIEKLQYGLTLSAGYGTWNIYSYYGLSNLFNASDVNGVTLKTSDFKIGLKFYIL